MCNKPDVQGPDGIWRHEGASQEEPEPAAFVIVAAALFWLAVTAVIAGGIYGAALMARDLL